MCLSEVSAAEMLLYDLVNSSWWEDFKVKLAIISPAFLSSKEVLPKDKRNGERMEWIRTNTKIWVPSDLDRGALMMRDGLFPAVSSGFYGAFGDMVGHVLDDVFVYFGEDGSDGGEDEQEGGAEHAVAESFVASEVSKADDEIL
jgi:hypothetical protein